MYRNILLTALLIVAIVIAIEVRPQMPAAIAEPEISPAAEELLDRRIPSLILHEGTCREAIEQMRRATGVPIRVDWATIPVWDKTPVNAELHDIALGDALAYLFRMDRVYYHDREQVDFDVIDRGLFIACSDRFPGGTMRLRIYDVRDLLTDQYWGCPSGPNPMETERQRLQAVAEVIECFAGPRDWQMESHRSGSHGSSEAFGYGDIQFSAGRLFIKQTTRGHQQVEAALQRLRNGGIAPAAGNP